MNPSEILALQPGPGLDKAVHNHVFNKTGKAPAYSTDDSAALLILDKIPLFVASVDPDKPDYNAAKPYVAGRLQHERSVQGDITILRVVGATKAVTLCKAALLALAKMGPIRDADDPPTMAKRIRDQVALRRGKQPAKRISNPKGRQPIPLRKMLPQPAAGVTKNMQRMPLPKRKPFVAAAAQQPREE